MISFYYSLLYACFSRLSLKRFHFSNGSRQTGLHKALQWAEFIDNTAGI